MKFVYVDESGTAGYSEKSTSLKFFVLAGMVIDADNMIQMETQVRKIKSNFLLFPEDEFKWNSSYSKHGLTFDEYHSLREEKFELINELSDCVIATVMDKKNSYKKPYINSHNDLYKQALYLLMERICRYVDEINTSVVFVIDSRKNAKNAKLDEELALAYKNALRMGTYYFRQGFPHFSETAFFTTSEDSAGLQLADYCAGAIQQYYETGKKDWYLKLRPTIRNHHGKISGFGIKQFPTSPKIIL